MGSMVSMLGLLERCFIGANGPDLFGDIDAYRTPGDAAAAADAAGAAELVMPGGQFVSQPLAVARPGRGADAAAMNVGIVHGETDVLPPPPFGHGAGQVSDILDGMTEAGGADPGAVAAVEAAGRDFVPAGMLVIAIEEFLEALGVQFPAHRGGPGGHHAIGSLDFR